MEFKDIELMCGDCLELLDRIEEASIDLAIIDPPYKLNKTTGGVSKTGFASRWTGMIQGKNAGFQDDINFSDWLPKLYRILKQNSDCYIWANDKNLSDIQKEAENVGFRLHNILVWEKNNLTPNRWYMKCCEFILYLYKGKAIPINDKSSTQLLKIRNKPGKEKYHPTEKPVEAIEYFIKNSSQIGDTVIDCFMGSGSTGVACVNTGRNFIGMEIDDKYFNTAKERIANSGRQDYDIR